MVKIRLRRVGRRKKVAYWVVVADSKVARDGGFIERIGHYDPRTDPPTVVIQQEKAREWIGHGAQPTDAVAYLLHKAGVIPEAPKRVMKPKVEEEPKKEEQVAEAPAAEAPAAEAPKAEVAKVETKKAEAKKEEASAAEVAKAEPKKAAHKKEEAAKEEAPKAEAKAEKPEAHKPKAKKAEEPKS